jgi:DNA invertase Pin-like site-specific DNA recombinase
MATAYSYIRFSSKKQERGDSIRRQAGMAEEWMGRHPEHILDTTLRLRDLGVSAFRGKNLDKSKGDLGKFIALAKEGRITPGSILLLERIDRFSRGEVWKVLGILGELVEAGVEIVLLADGERVVSKKNMNDMGVFLPTVIEMILAHEASLKASARLCSAWRHKRQDAQANGKRLTRLCPAWLTIDERTDKFVVKDGAKKTLTSIFQKAAEGIGQRAIAGQCEAKFPSLTGKTWNSSFIQLILGNRQVLGEFQPGKRGPDGESIPDGPPIKDYFPAVIDETLFDRVQAARRTRRSARGRNTQFVNLFVSLIRMPDGTAGNVWTTKHRRAGVSNKVATRRIASYGHLQKQPGACPLTLDYWKVERYVLALLYQLRADDLFPAPDGGTGLAEKRQELAAVEQRAADLEAALTSADSTRAVPEIVRAVMELDERRKAIAQEIEKINQTAAVVKARPIETAKSVLAAIESKPESEHHALRLRLRGLISDIVERIDLAPYRSGRRVETTITVRWRNCAAQHAVRVNTGAISPGEFDEFWATVRQTMPDLEKGTKTGGHKIPKVLDKMYSTFLKNVRVDVVEMTADDATIRYTGEPLDGPLAKAKSKKTAAKRKAAIAEKPDRRRRPK